MRWPREPLIYFALAGALLFFASGFVDSSAEDYRIEITEADLRRLSDQWQAQMGRPPSATEMDGLSEQWIKEEIYYREATRLSLNQNDVIIRRRLVQKLTFLTEDIATSQEPDAEALQSFYGEHLERYTDPDRYSFNHRYFSSERREDAEVDARAALDDPDAPGDPFMLQRSYAERSLREVGELFGRDFAASLAELEPGAWTGPIRSAYGWHLVEIQQLLPSAVRPFAEVSTRVANDAQQEQREAANKAFYEGLKGRYEIVTP